MNRLQRKSAVLAILGALLLLLPMPGRSDALVVQLSPTTDGTCVGVITFDIEITGGSPPYAVDLIVDGEPVETLTSGPFRFEHDFGRAASDSQIKAVARDTMGNQAESTYSCRPGENIIDVEILYPKSGSRVSGAVQILLKVTDHPDSPVDSVDLFVDDEFIASLFESPYSFSWNAGKSQAERTLRAVATNARGKTAEAEIVINKPKFVYREQVELVGLEVVVTDAARRYVTGLEPKDFEVREDGEEQEISYFSVERKPLRLALVLDTSGSAEPYIQEEIRAAEQFVKDVLEEGDRVMVMHFNDMIEIEAELTEEFDLIEGALKNVKVRRNSGTALFDAVHDAITALDAEDGRKAVILLSDGEDTASGRYDEEDVAELAKKTDVRTYTIGMRPRAPSSRDFGVSGQLRNRNHLFRGDLTMSALADETGGLAFFPTSITQLTPIYAQIGTELRSFYSVGYEPTNSKKDGSYREIEVKMKKRSYEARTRSGYVAPREEAAVKQ